MRQPARADQPPHRARQQAEAVDVVLVAALEQQLQPDAHAEQVRAAVDRVADRVVEPGCLERGHRGTCRADAGDHDEPRVCDHVRVRR